MSEDSHPAVVDEAVIESLREVERQSSRGLVDRLIEVYDRNGAQLVRSLEQAVADGDAAAVKDAAHSLKSSSANLGARRVADLCARVERAGRDGELAGSEQLAERVRAEFEAARAALANLSGPADRS